MASQNGHHPAISVPAISVNDLEFAYPDGRLALRGVELSIKPGEKVAILGPNGAGKSTLLLHLNGLLHAGSGSVAIMGREVREDDKRGLQEIRALVGVVFQDPDDQLFSPSIHDDVAFGPIYMGLSVDEVEARVSEALSQVGLEGYEDRMPFHLSGGEKKRAAIASVLSMQSADTRARRAVRRTGPASAARADPAAGPAGADHPRHHARHAHGQGDIHALGHHGRRQGSRGRSNPRNPDGRTTARKARPGTAVVTSSSAHHAPPNTHTSHARPRPAVSTPSRGTPRR